MLPLNWLERVLFNEAVRINCLVVSAVHDLISSKLVLR